MRVLRDLLVPNTAETSTHVELNNISLYKYSRTLIRFPKGIYVSSLSFQRQSFTSPALSLSYPYFSYLICMKKKSDLTWHIQSLARDAVREIQSRI